MVTVPNMVYDQIRSQYGIPKKVRITCKEDILQIKSIAGLSSKLQEHFMVISLNAAAEVIKVRTITTGLLNHSLVHPREVFRDAIKDNANTIICLHNHPSGNLEPSQADLQVTKQLKDSGDIIGITLLDHIIVTKYGIASMRECGYL